jgi:hypothetical protein
VKELPPEQSANAEPIPDLAAGEGLVDEVAKSDRIAVDQPEPERAS